MSDTHRTFIASLPRWANVIAMIALIGIGKVSADRLLHEFDEFKKEVLENRVRIVALEENRKTMEKANEAVLFELREIKGEIRKRP